MNNFHFYYCLLNYQKEKKNKRKKEGKNLLPFMLYLNLFLPSLFYFVLTILQVAEL